MINKPITHGRGYKFVWGIASLGTSLISGVFAALLPIFYQDYLGLSARWIAVASLVYAIWNAFNDPLFGYITDNTRSKLGRRIPYMRFTAPFLALTFILVWFAPAQAGQTAIFWWMLISMLLYDTCYTIIGLVYSSLLPEITESDSERNDLQISAALFGLLGMLLGFIIPDLFRPKAGGDPSFLPLQTAMIVVGILGALLIIATTLKVKERPEFTRVDKPIGLREFNPVYLLEQIILNPGSSQFHVNINVFAGHRICILSGRLCPQDEYDDIIGLYIYPLNHWCSLHQIFYETLWDCGRASNYVGYCRCRAFINDDFAKLPHSRVPGFGRIWAGWPTNLDQCFVCTGG